MPNNLSRSTSWRDLNANLESIHQLMDKLNRKAIVGATAQQAHRTVMNLVRHYPAEDLALVIYAYRQLQIALEQLLASWKLNQHVIQQGIANALEQGDPVEADRLNGRLAGIVLLWEQIERALRQSRLGSKVKGQAQGPAPTWLVEANALAPIGAEISAEISGQAQRPAPTEGES